jgi:hypothetical protein
MASTFIYNALCPLQFPILRRYLLLVGLYNRTANDKPGLSLAKVICGGLREAKLAGMGVSTN